MNVVVAVELVYQYCRIYEHWRREGKVIKEGKDIDAGCELLLWIRK